LQKLVLATRNQGKIKEFERLLAQHASEIQVFGLSDFPDMPDVAETGKTLSENAFLKSRAIATFTNLPALADDSGLFVDYLNGAPGIYSARFAGYQGQNTSERDRLNIERLLRELRNVPKANRKAQFNCAVAFTNLNLEFEVQEIGTLSGEIAEAAIGDAGFGYDGVFIPQGFEQTLAQLGAGVKDRISHRGLAMRAIVPSLSKHL
jgi:XTP/dITP diphosphohydrolase